jgi:site-specific DNA recombinase
MRCGLYARISEDRLGETTATGRQLEDCRKFAEAHGWTVGEVYEDRDTSAYQRTTIRPEFERLVEDIRARRIDGVIAWKVDRLARRQKDLVRLDEVCRSAGAWITTLDGVDTRTAQGRFLSELLTSLATMEGENIAARVRRKHQERAEQGLPLTSGTRAFGYTANGRELVQAEAALIKEAAGRVLAGESMRGISQDWISRGIVSPVGRPWLPTSLRRSLLRAGLAAHRERDGKLYPVHVPAILTLADHHRLKAVLMDPRRRTNTGTARRYLLSGFLRCGLCGALLVARPRRDGVRRYTCASRPGVAACGRLGRVAQPIEELITEMVFVALDDVDVRPHMQPDADGDDAEIVRAILDDEAALEQLAVDHYADHTITRGEHGAARAVIEARLIANREMLARTPSRIVQQFLGAGGALRDRWSNESLEWKRAVIAAVITNIVVEPERRPGAKDFDPSLIKPVWRY